MDVLCQMQADVLGVTVRRPEIPETTALGAAYLAGIAEGVWSSTADAAGAWRAEASFTPSMDAEVLAAGRAQWTRAVERARGWARDTT
jgi:glycerol kinase